MTRYNNVGVCIALIVVSAGGALAQTPAASRDKAFQEMGQQLNSSTSLSAEQIIAQVQSLLEEDPNRAVNAIKGSWIKSLNDNKRYEVAAELALRAEVATAWDIQSLESLQTTRIRSLLSAGRKDEALAQAKALYNLASMRTTGDAILIISQCITEAGGDPAQFRQEQTAGKAMDRPKGSEPLRSAALDKIKIDSKPYDEAIKKLTAEDYRTLSAKGNLLLLADRPKEAEEVFKQAYELAEDGQIGVASENIARAMKAEDGTIGRANAWVLSIRPKAKAKP